MKLLHLDIQTDPSDSVFVFVVAWVQVPLYKQGVAFTHEAGDGFCQPAIGGTGILGGLFFAVFALFAVDG